MADSSSPLFNPPIKQLVGDDAQIVKVPMDKVPFGFHKSQAPNTANPWLATKNLKNGQ